RLPPPMGGGSAHRIARAVRSGGRLQVGFDLFEDALTAAGGDEQPGASQCHIDHEDVGEQVYRIGGQWVEAADGGDQQEHEGEHRYAHVGELKFAELAQVDGCGHGDHEIGE